MQVKVQVPAPGPGLARAPAGPRGGRGRYDVRGAVLTTNYLLCDILAGASLQMGAT